MPTRKKLSNKKKLTIVLTAFLSILIFSVVALYILTLDDTPKFYFPPESDGPFAEVDWSDDHLSDPEYLALGDRLSVYADVPPFDNYPIANAEDYTLGNEVLLVYRVLEAVRAGDATLYNSFFSDFYLRVVGEKGAFTQQKLYDIKIQYLKTVQEEDVGNLTVFRVAYKIMDNNGTYRNDVASDEIRFVYFNVRTYGGRLEVYSMTYEKFN